MRSWVSIGTAVLFAALLVYTVISNTVEVTVVLPLWQWRTKLWAAMIGSAIVGAVAATLMVTWPLLRLKLQQRRHTRRIAELEQEIHGLRTLPIAGDSSASGRTQTQKV
jgi:uncharacterized integral membrane protein